MLSVTFTITNREKTFTKKGLEECVSTFLKEYGEAIDEVVKIHIVDVENNEEQHTTQGKKSCATFLKGFQLKLVQQ